MRRAHKRDDDRFATETVLTLFVSFNPFVTSITAIFTWALTGCSMVLLRDVATVLNLSAIQRRPDQRLVHLERVHDFPTIFRLEDVNIQTVSTHGQRLGRP